MKILVCGGRDYGNVIRTKARIDDEPLDVKEQLRRYKHIHSVLNRIVYENSTERNDNDNWLPTDIIIINGAAKGADSAASDFAIVHYCQLREYPADWNKHGKAAGPIRNQEMLNDNPDIDLVIAFPGGRGTADMIRRAKKKNIKVIEIE